MSSLLQSLELDGGRLFRGENLAVIESSSRSSSVSRALQCRQRQLEEESSGPLAPTNLSGEDCEKT
jgi:hypothetical protein